MEIRHTGVYQLTSPKQTKRPPDNTKPGHVHRGHHSNSKTQASSSKNHYPSQMSHPLLLHYYSAQSDRKSFISKKSMLLHYICLNVQPNAHTKHITTSQLSMIALSLSTWQIYCAPEHIQKCNQSSQTQK